MTVVAVKTLKEDAREVERKDLLSEYELLKNVSHPNVIKLFGASTIPPGPIYLIMEFAEHGSLRYNFKRRIIFYLLEYFITNSYFGFYQSFGNFLHPSTFFIASVCQYNQISILIYCSPNYALFYWVFMSVASTFKLLATPICW